MARKYQWSPDKYRAIVGGKRSESIEGLRSFVSGFSADDGYDLRYVKSWTPYQRRKVRETFHKLQSLQAQSKRPVRARGENLRKLQDAFHGGIPSKNFKVAFVPDVEPQYTLPGAKKHPPKVRILKDGVSIERRNFTRVMVPFDQRALVKDTKGEIQWAVEQMPGASLFYVQVGEHQTINGKSLGLLTRQILDFMQKYDGKKELPSTSGNRGDNPKHHHWKYWLNGLVGYVIPRGKSLRSIIQKISKGRAKNEELKAERNRYLRRHGEKGRKL